MKATYRFADQTISVNTTYSDTHTLCRDYRTGDHAGIEVLISRQDIEFERLKSEREEMIKGGMWSNKTDGYLETLAVYRKIAEIMPYYNTILFHGSCVAVDGEGYLFTAKSGTGKSTHTGLWRQLLGERAIMVNDDKPLIRVSDTAAVAYGTPWDGKHRLSTNMAVPLKAICLLGRSEENHIETITASDAYPILLQQTYRPSDPTALRRTISLLDWLSVRVRLYRLGCNMNLDAAAVSYEIMRGSEHETEKNIYHT